MLDRTKTISKLNELAGTLFTDISSMVRYAYKLFGDSAQDDLFCQQAQTADRAWNVPSWDGNLKSAIKITKPANPYTLIGVDGSQIYPDRHHGVSCFLINVGTVILRYGSTSGRPARLSSDPYIYSGQESENGNSIDMVNALRQEYEFKAGIQATDAIRQSNCHSQMPSTVLMDGSLIFWYLESKGDTIRQTFLDRYIALLGQYQQQNIPIASYISAPKTREISNIIRLRLANFDIHAKDAYAAIDNVNDASLCTHFLAPSERTIVFASRAKITTHYPPAIRPHFFYINTGTEIGRIEIPAWIAHDKDLVDLIASTTFDQCSKGHGYPVVLAEAHEQAVVKGPDREFFFHLVHKKAMEQKGRYSISSKAVRKRTATM